MRELILRGLHLFFPSLSLCISVSLPPDILPAPSWSSFFLPLILSLCFSALILLLTIIHICISSFSPPCCSLVEFPPSLIHHLFPSLPPCHPPPSLWFLAGFMGLWCMVISLQTHLSAYSVSSFSFLFSPALLSRALSCALILIGYLHLICAYKTEWSV